MTDLRRHIAELETKAAEFALIGDLATDPAARVLNTRLAQELQTTIEQLLQQQTPDGLFLAHAAEKCRRLARAVADQRMVADLQKLAAEFEETARARAHPRS